MALGRMRDIDLLLIGKTGNGKSATGNSILAYKAFLSKPSLSSVTTKSHSGVRKYDGRMIKVVDTPGVGDTRYDAEGGTDLVMKAMEEAISMNTRGYHAFLLVIKFGGRFTKEDEDTIKFLKLCFGDDFVKKHCILVMTYGDNFKSAVEGSDLTFSDWCEEQPGVFKTLYNECDRRILLFDNRAKNGEMEKQIADLVHVIDTLWQPGHRYRDNNFKEAQKAREKYVVECKEPQIKEEMMNETGLILQEIAEIQKNAPEEQVKALDELLGRIDLLHKSISSEDKGTGALHKLLKHVEATQQAVRENKKVSEQVIKIKNEMTAQHEAEKRDMEAKIEALQQGYQQLRDESETGIAETVVNGVTFPLRAVARGIDWLFS